MTLVPPRIFEVLLAEDNPADVDLFLEAASDAGLKINVTVVEDGDRAIAELEKPRRDLWPDLIVLDLNLPRRNGREVLSLIKSHPQRRSIPTLILSTSAAENDVVSCYDLQVNAYLVKPVDFDQYRQLLSDIARFWFAAATLPSEFSHV